MRNYKPYTADEERILMHYIKSELPWVTAHLELPGRSANSILSKIYDLRANGPRHLTDEDEEPVVLTSRMNQDRAFQAALRAAIKAGHETMPVPPIVDPDFRPVTFFAPLRGSGCSSSGAACSEIGEPESTDRRYSVRSPDPRHIV